MMMMMRVKEMEGKREGNENFFIFEEKDDHHHLHLPVKEFDLISDKYEGSKE